jgi:putative tricarboxylic transport membrane protein
MHHPSPPDQGGEGMKPGNRMRIHEMVLGLFFITLAVGMLAFTGTFPAFPGQKYGPALFPRIIGVGIMLCGALLLWRGWRNPAPDGDRRLFAFSPAFSERTRLVSFLLVPGGIVFYLLLAERLGFIPTAFFLLCGLFFWFRVKPVPALVLAIITTYGMQWFFGTMMRVPLPRGLFMQVLYGG